MKRFRRARGRTRGQRRLSRLAGPCLAAVLAAWPAVLTASGVASSGAAAPVRASGPVLSVTLTAVLRPQARVVNPGRPPG